MERSETAGCIAPIRNLLSNTSCAHGIGNFQPQRGRLWPEAVYAERPLFWLHSVRVFLAIAVG